MRLLLFLAGGAITIIGAIGIKIFPIMAIPVTVIGIMILLSGLKSASKKGVIDRQPKKKCPQCAEEVLVDAKLCRFCRYDFVTTGNSP